MQSCADRRTQTSPVFKMAAAYVVIAWLVVQGASIALPAFDAPAWILRVFILAALLGLSLVFAWAFEMTRDGIQRKSGACRGARGGRRGIAC